MSSKDLIQNRVLNAFAGLDVDLFLFGSRATGKARARSDYDIGYSTDTVPSARLLAELKDDLQEMPISEHVDLVDFSHIPETFKNIALQKVEIWKRKKKNSLFK